MEIKTILLLLAVTLSISALPQPDNLTPATTSANTNFQAAISNAKLGGKVQCAKCATECAGMFLACAFTAWLGPEAVVACMDMEEGALVDTCVSCFWECIVPGWAAMPSDQTPIPANFCTSDPEIPTKLCEATMQKKSELDAQKGDKVVKADPGLVNPGGAANIGTE